MSFIHRYLVGHFDLYAFSMAGPAVLRPVDGVGAQRLLKTICKPLTQEHLKRAFSLDRGYAVCEWSALGIHSEIAWQYALALAEAENCLVLEIPGMVVYPPKVVWPTVKECGPLSPEAAERMLATDDADELRKALYVWAHADKDASWVHVFCGRLAKHAHFHLRGNAMYAFGLLAHRGHLIDRACVQPLIEGGLADEHAYVRAQAETAARTIELSLKWLFPHFDNDKPEEVVATYSNGWVRCPTCSWRFATYDVGAFREGRCMTCRQKLRTV